MEMDFKTKKKKIYIPIKKTIKEIMKGLKLLELQIPIARLARMELAGLFLDESLTEFKKTFNDYLRVVQKYRQLNFDFMNKTKIVFDREMTKDGSFAPGLKQYNSVKNQVYESILKTDGKAWVLSYDQYLPTIRDHADKRSKKPRNGKQMYGDLKVLFKDDLKNIIEMQKLSYQISKLFLNDINYAQKHPELSWQEWLTEDKFDTLKKKSKRVKNIRK
jgi:hypothetical protein